MRLLTVFVFLLLASAAHANEPASSASGISVQVLKRDVTDVPLQTLVRVELLVSGRPTEAQLRVLLNQQYEIANSGRYKHHSRPTAIQIAVYKSRDHAASGSGQWLALLNYHHLSIPQPTVEINMHQFTNLGKTPETRLGLTEVQRKKIFSEYVLAQDLAADRQVDRTPYENAVARKYKLSREQLNAIVGEAQEKDWPLPTLQR